jgi:hypothetical protein
MRLVDDCRLKQIAFTIYKKDDRRISFVWRLPFVLMFVAVASSNETGNSFVV